MKIVQDLFGYFCLKYVINLDEYANTGTHWVALYSMELHSNGNRITCFDSFAVKQISKESNKFTDNKHFKGSTITNNISRIQRYNYWIIWLLSNDRLYESILTKRC